MVVFARPRPCGGGDLVGARCEVDRSRVGEVVEGGVGAGLYEAGAGGGGASRVGFLGGGGGDRCL